MGYRLLIYNRNAYKECLLPAVNNTDYRLYLKSRWYGTPWDIELCLEIIDLSWQFVFSEQYSAEDIDGNPLKLLRGGQQGCLKLSNGQKIYFLVIEEKESFWTYQKYVLKNIYQLSIGNEIMNDICIQMPIQTAGKNYAKLIKTGEYWFLQPEQHCLVYVNHIRVHGSRQLTFGDSIEFLGLKIIFLGNILAVNSRQSGCRIKESQLCEMNPEEQEKLLKIVMQPKSVVYRSEKNFHRSPRKIYKIDSEPVEIEEPPKLKEESKKPLALIIGPSMTMALPMLMGSGIAIFASRMSSGNSGVFMYTGIATALASAMIGTMWALINLTYEKKKNKEEELHRFEAYSEYLIRCSGLIKEKYERNQRNMQRMYIAAVDCCSQGSNRAELWNRNESHEDFLTYRLGIGVLPFQVPIVVPKEKFTMISDTLSEKPRMIQKSFSLLQDVPICINLAKHRLVGIIGGKGKQGARNVMYALAVQIAAENCYTDVKMVFLYNEKRENEQDWRFAKWLPHVWSENGRIRMLAKNTEQGREVLYELTQIMRRRFEQNTSGNTKTHPFPHYILFVEDSAVLQGELIEKYIFQEAESCGISTVIMEECYEDLPNACDYIIENTMEFHGMYSVRDNVEERVEICFDAVTPEQVEWFSRELSEIEVTETEIERDLPETLTFFEMYRIQQLPELHVLEKWKKNRTYETLRALIGQKAGGEDCFLDIHEKYHGPHGLIAGTTGSGKSETLQTYLLSLAISYSPQDVNFFLIDYKGGGMAHLFDGLPHIAGEISNLSGNQIRRAMVSIKSENRRRQKIFKEYAVNNINAYTRLYKNGETKQPIPHLLIVVDEFAELKREEPEFMKELISVAQVGRSLGVHLILATQKPSGTVDDNIWSNSKFRLCLRVQDKQDSQDMLHRPEAAYITQAGRAYLQVGNDELFELFQSGYSGAVYDETGKENKEIAILLSDTGKAAFIGNYVKKEKNTGKKERTQLEAVIDYLREIAVKNGYQQTEKLWLPILPTQLFLEDLEGYMPVFNEKNIQRSSVNRKIQIPIGMYDDPENQLQRPVCINFSESGHLAVIGMAATGKSTFLQTLLYGLMSSYTPEEMNVYIVDYSTRTLDSFAEMPHVGGIVYEEEDKRLAKLFVLMEEILEERKKVLKGSTYNQYICRKECKMPMLFLVIDNYGNFRQKTLEQYDEILLKIAKEGINYGILLILTAGGIGMTDLPNRMAENIRMLCTLELNDKFSYAEVLRESHIEILPETNVKGRGLVKVEEKILEYQTALALKAEDDLDRIEKIREISQNIRHVWNGKSADSIPEIPDKAVWKDFCESERTKAILEQADRIPVGYDSQSAKIYGLNLREIYCYVISGKTGSGKTNFLKVIMAASLLSKRETYLIDFKGELEEFAAKKEVSYIGQDKELFAFLSELLPLFKERNSYKRELYQAETEDEEMFDKMQKYSAKVICIANLPDFIRHVEKPEEGVGGMRAFIENLFDRGAGHHVFWFAVLPFEETASISGNRLFQLFTRSRMGIHFGGEVSAQRILNFDQIPYMQQGKVQKPGLGMLPDNEEGVCEIVTPRMKG